MDRLAVLEVLHDFAAPSLGLGAFCSIGADAAFCEVVGSAAGEAEGAPSVPDGADLSGWRG